MPSFNCYELPREHSLASRFGAMAFAGNEAWTQLMGQVAELTRGHAREWRELRPNSGERAPDEPPPAFGEHVRPDADDDVAGQQLILEPMDRFLRAASYPAESPSTRCTLFISHKSTDQQLAERVAELAQGEGFDYWLDVHDPTLQAANGSALPEPIKAMIIAAIIEIALLNSTHVIALNTPSSRNSRWVPYEFGRGKRGALPLPLPNRRHPAASWFHPREYPSAHGDYLHLSPCLTSERGIRSWLQMQAQCARSKSSDDPQRHPRLPEWT